MNKLSRSILGGVVCALALGWVWNVSRAAQGVESTTGAEDAAAARIRFKEVEWTATGSVLLRVKGQEGVSYVIERSADLKSWAPVQTNTLAGSDASVTDPGTQDGEMAFYRLRILDREADVVSDGQSRRLRGLRRMVEGAPSVSITSPTNTASFDSPESIVIEADASDDGTVTKVEFFADLTKLGEDTSSPFSYTWDEPDGGAYTLTATATDDSELSTKSSPVDISVYDGGGGGENIAQGQSASQSSTAFGGSAGLAVDGNTNGNFSAGSVTHTASNSEAWWELDLGSVQEIDTIDIWNRTDCCSSRLSNFYLLVSDDAFESTSLGTVTNQSGVWNSYTSGAAGTLTTIQVSRSGRYVRVQLTGTDYLSLAEVQVWRWGPPAPPADPSGLVAEAFTSTQNRMRWVLNSSDETAVKVERKSGTAGVYEMVAVLGEGTEAWWDEEAPEGVTNFYRVRASNAGGYSDYSNEAEAKVVAGVETIPLTNMVLWLRAPSLTGLTNGQPVSSWTDISALGNNATQGTGANQPLWIEEGVNSNAVVRFDGSNDYFTLPNILTTATQAEAYVVIQGTDDMPSLTPNLWKMGSSGFMAHYPHTDGVVYEDFASNTRYVVGDPSVPLDQWHVLNIAGRSGEWSLWINGILQYARGNNTFGKATSPTLGGYGGYYYSGDMAEVIIFNQVLTSAQRNALGSYLNFHYAMVGSAPAAPTNLTASALSATQINVTWELAGGAAGVWFDLERKTGAGGSYSVIASVGETMSFLDGDRSSGTTYYYRVRARNLAGTSGYSEEASATTLAAGAGLPTGDLRLWLKADSGVLLKGPNGTVGQWVDLSGNHNDASQGTTANQPALVLEALNGRPVIRFDGANDYFTLPNFLNGATQAEAFVVIKGTEDVPSTTRNLWKVGGNGYMAHYPHTDGVVYEDFGSNLRYVVGDPSVPLDQWHVLNVAGQSGEWTFRINGLLQLWLQSNTFGNSTAPTLGGSGGYYYSGDMAEVLVFDRVLTTEERELVGNYLNAQYAVVGAPATPTNLTATAVSATQVSLTWESDLGSAGTTFEIERQEGAGSFAQVAELADGTSFVDQGVSPGTTNYYRVRARTIAGVSAYSAEASAVTPGAGTDLPMNELLWWLKADTGAVRLGTNGNVRQWLDVSGNQYDANQASSANQPRWIDTAINGRPAVRFDGTNDYFTLPEFLAGALQAEVFVVLKAAEDVPTGWRILWKLGGDNYAPFYPYTDGTIREDFGSKTVRIIPNPQQALDAFHMFNVSASMSGWEARVNGVFLLGMTNYFHHWPTPTLGSSSSSYFAGDVAEIMLFTRTLTALERDAVGEYLDAKYSLESTATDASGPSTPTNLLATAHAPGQILLSWTRPTTNESSFQIERKLGTNGNYEVLDVIASGSTNYLDEAVDPQSAYFYRIKAHNYFGDSGYSDQVSPPLVTITFPLHPATSTPGATNSVSAQATDTDGSVVEVEFYVQGTLVGTATNAPYSASWIASEIGVAVLTAKAIDDQGNSQFSEEVLVRVYPDTDEDGLADDIEAILGTDPSDADTDGDSVPDAEDAFPLDPTRSTLPSSDPEDDTGPAITLDEPLNATLLP